MDDTAHDAAARQSQVAHVANFRWKPEVDAQDVARVEKELTALRHHLDGVVSYVFGPDLGLRAGNADFAVVGVFADLQAYRSYAEDTEHQRILAEVISPLLQERHAVQLLVV